ncbi:MAG: hypothetical protein J6P72_09640 [Firmicutes bacterium]|nr:hypothetical protein [Bacillota bacterium]
MSHVNMERLNQLLEDKAFVEKMMSLDTKEEVKEIFNANGVDFTMEDVEDMAKELERVSEAGDEISEDALEDVAGGFAITLAGVVAAGKIAVAVGAAGLSIYKWYKSRR